MHAFWTDKFAMLPRRSATLLYERSGLPFKTTVAFQERLRKLMSELAVQEVIVDLVAREMMIEDASSALPIGGKIITMSRATAPNTLTKNGCFPPLVTPTGGVYG